MSILKVTRPLLKGQAQTHSKLELKTLKLAKEKKDKNEEKRI